MANISFEKWMQESYKTTGGKGKGFSQDEQGAYYQAPSSSGTPQRIPIMPQTDERELSSFDRWMQDAYETTGGMGASFSHDDQGNAYVDMWQPEKQQTKPDNRKWYQKFADMFKRDDNALTKAYDDEDAAGLAYRRALAYGMNEEEIASRKAALDRAQSRVERLGGKANASWLGGALSQIGGGYLTTAGRLGQAGSKLHDISTDEQRAIADSEYAGWMTDDLSQQNAAQAYREGELESGGILDEIKLASSTAYRKGIEITRNGNENIDADLTAKSGAEKFLTNAAVSGMGMLADRLTGLGLGSMAIRVYGNGIAEAEKLGLSGIDADIYAAKTAAVEVLSEKIFGGPFKKTYGAGFADKLVNGVRKAAARPGAGEALLDILIAFGEEGLEEVAANLGNYFADRGLGYRDEAWNSDDTVDTIYSFLVGGFMGGFMGSANVIGTSQRGRVYSPAQQELVESGLESDKKTYSYKLADIYKSKLDAGKNLSNYQLGKLAAANEEAIRAEQNNEGEAEAETVVEQTAQKLNLNPAQAKILRDDFELGEADAETFARGVEEAYQYGKLGASVEDMQSGSSFTDALTETQRMHAYEFGRMSEDLPAAEQNVQEMLSGASEGISDGESVETFAADYGEDAEKVVEIYKLNPDMDVHEFSTAFESAYNIGRSMQPESVLRSVDNIQGLRPEQSKAAWSMGRKFSSTGAAKSLSSLPAAKTGGKKLNRKGTVRGDGVKLADLKKAFNDRQNTAYRLLTRYAEATGVNIVLYSSKTNAAGEYAFDQGRFQWADDTIFIDINSGLYSISDVDSLGKYTMLRTFAHEFTHFIEKWSPVEYNNFRTFVFQTLTDKGLSVNDLIESQMAADKSGKLDYEQASREVVADAMVDILPDSDIVQRLAAEHESIYKKLLSKLREFVGRLRMYYRNIGTLPSKEAQALKAQVNGNLRYMDSIVQMWTKAGQSAVQNYKAATGSEAAEPVRKPKQPASKPQRTGNKVTNEPIAAADTPTKPKEAKTDSIPDSPPSVKAVAKSTEPEKTTSIEEAKRELRKVVRMPIKGTNLEALYEGIKNKELSRESITYGAKVKGFTNTQREYLAEALMDGVYTDVPAIKVKIPYDGSFEIQNSPANVAKVLNELNVKANQEIFFDQQTDSILRGARRVVFVEVEGREYISTGSILLPISESAKEYAREAYEAEDYKLDDTVLAVLKGADELVSEVPILGKSRKLAVYEIQTKGGSIYLDKRLLDRIDGGTFYAGRGNVDIIKSVSEDGTVLGYVLGLKDVDFRPEKPSNLKSFSKKAEKPKPTEQKKKDEPEKPKITEETVKLNDFGEKIGGARKDLWASRGLEVGDLEAMNEREAEKYVKKDNVWKRPDYAKLIEGGRDRGILYAVNEIRKSLNQNISYRRSENAEQRAEKRALFVETVKEIQRMAEKAESANDLIDMGYKWGLDNGYLEDTGNIYQKYRYTSKWHNNPALSGGNLIQTADYLGKNFKNLEKLAEKAQFAVDSKSKLPKGYSILQDTDKGTWFITKGSFIVKDGFASYDDALKVIQNSTAAKKKKTRFVPAQLLEVHRKGPDYRDGQNVDGKDYISSFGFKGGEFGNWMSAKDRQVSLNYGFDALMDLADALGIANEDISFSGELSIAFGARGQGLSGAAAHYEPERRVINLTKMNGAGSLAHEWFHGLDDFMGGFTGKLATDRPYNLPDKTKNALQNLIITMQYRDQTDEEADLSATKHFEQAERSIRYQLSNQFGWVERVRNGTFPESDARFYNRAPTIEDVDKYDQLLQKLVDTGDGKVLEQLSDLRKEVTGHVIPKEDRVNIGHRLFSLRGLLDGSSKLVQRGRVRTNFYNNSRRFGELHHRDGDYWDSTIEMSARAFACYISDKTQRQNDYLSAHSESAMTLDTDKNGNLIAITAFPTGEERNKINKAFDQLISALIDDGYLHKRAESEKPDIVQYQRRKAESRTISKGMSDQERYEVLKDKKIALRAKTDMSALRDVELKIGQSTDIADALTPTMRRNLFRAIGREFGVFKQYFSQDFDLQFSFGTRNMRHSLNKQGKNYPDFAKMLTCFDDVIDNAVGIEVHNRNDEGYKTDETLEAVYVLVSAFDDGDRVVPVKLEIKEFSDKENTLYVAISLESIKRDEVVAQAGVVSDVATNARSSEIILSDFFAKINPTDTSFLKYVPAQFFEETETVNDFSQDSTRARAMTNREVLEYAADNMDEAALTPAQREALSTFKERLSRLEDLQEQRREAGQQYKEQMFTKGGKRSEAAETKNRMDILDSKIKSLENSIVSLEDKDVLRQVLVEARKVVERHERTQGEKVLKAYREQRNESTARKKYRARVQAEVSRLHDMLMRPANKNVLKRVPATIQKTVADFISGIDFTSKRQLSGGAATKADAEYVKRMSAMRDAIKANIELLGAYSGYADLPPTFMERFQAHIDHVNELVHEHSGEYVVNMMDAAELRELAHTLTDLRRYIQDMNKFHNNSVYQHSYEAAEDTIEHTKDIKRKRSRKGKVPNFWNNFLQWQYMRPALAFERFGKGGESIFHEFRQGQATQAFLAKKLVAFAESTYTAKEVEQWSKDTITVEIGGEPVTIPVTAAMSFYCLNRRPQARTHIYGDGIRIATYEKDNFSYQDEGHTINEDDARNIIGALTERQIEVAEALQKFMSEECAEWGNYVTLKRFATEVFGEAFYFPINSDGRYLAETGEESPANASLYALLNMGFTKELKENASNRIVLYNIFDVFANHTASMAQYRSFALPILDALKWFNYKTDDASVRDALASAFGMPAESRPGSGNKGYAEQFVLNLLKAYNGTAGRGDVYDSAAIRGLHLYNRAQVAYNFRVIIQQPMSITRAAMILSPKKIMSGLKKSATQMKALAEEMEKYSGIAAWKSLGFYDTNISRGLTSLIKQESDWMENITGVGMWGAEKADRFTWAAIWSAAKDTVKRSDYKSEAEYFEAVTTLFEEVIYKTQVVDSILTKAEFLRAQSFGARMLGSFMSEPSATISLLVDAGAKYSDDIAAGMSRSEAWTKNRDKIGKALTVYIVGQTILAAVQGVADAERDDDDYQTFIEKWKEAFKGNVVDELMPFGKIPILSEFYDLTKDALSKLGFDTYGNPVSSGWMQYAQYLSKSLEIFVDWSKGETKYTWWGGLYNLLRGVSGLTGVPIATASREAFALWNTVVGSFKPEWKFKTYDAGTKANIKYAYLDGYLTEDEAISYLIEKGEADDKNDAYWIIKSWETGEDSKYFTIKDAVLSRDYAAYQAAMQELISHGEDEKKVYSQIKKAIKEAFIDDGADPKLTRDFLTTYVGMSTSEAQQTVDSWKFSRDNPNIDWTDAQISTYTSDIKPTGITVQTYDTYLKQRKVCTGTDSDGDGKTDSGSVKSQVLIIIDALPLTVEQKDALYYANGWAASKINEAPWHNNWNWTYPYT